MRIIIGHDSSEPDASHVAAKSLMDVAGLEAEFLDLAKLRSQGLFTRPMDVRNGSSFDLISGAPCSTEFAISRFLTPLLVQTGFALFVDADVVFLRDPRLMLEGVDDMDIKAVYAVQHAHAPQATTKMVGKAQSRYRRKNWSSVMLFNCDHPANRRLSLRDVNERPGRDLHGFYWLHDSEIGALDPAWNWLVGEQPRPPHCGIAHFTNGGPFVPGWGEAEHDDIWLAAANGLKPRSA